MTPDGGLHFQLSEQGKARVRAGKRGPRITVEGGRAAGPIRRGYQMEFVGPFELQLRLMTWKLLAATLGEERKSCRSRSQVQQRAREPPRVLAIIWCGCVD